jgi:hypothetical protein
LDYLGTRTTSRHADLAEKYKTYDEAAFTKLGDYMDKYENNFNRHLKILLDSLDYYAATETVALSRLCALLSGEGEKGMDEQV